MEAMNGTVNEDLVKNLNFDVRMGNAYAWIKDAIWSPIAKVKLALNLQLLILTIMMQIRAMKETSAAKDTTVIRIQHSSATMEIASHYSQYAIDIETARESSKKTNSQFDAK